MNTVYKLRQPALTLLILLLSLSLFNMAALAQQNIGGIGAQLIIDTADGFTMPRIFALVPGSPADTTLHATDFIMEVNDISCKNKTIEEVVGMIRGEAGTGVKITVADTKEGKRERVYNLVRVGMQVAAPPPPPDPLAAFYNDCENEVKQMKRKGIEVVKTYTSECGNYFFNFNGEALAYHIRVMTMEEKPKTGYTPGFYPTAKAFDGDNEPAAIELTRMPAKDNGNTAVAQLEGTLTLKKAGVGVVSVQIHDDATKCRGMYIMVYK